MALSQQWLCSTCGGTNDDLDLDCAHCGELRADDAQLIVTGNPDPQLVFVLLDPRNGYAQSAVKIAIPVGDGEFMVGRNHDNPDLSGSRVKPAVDLYDHLQPYNGSNGRSYGISKFQAVIRRTGDQVTIERYKSDGNPLYKDATDLKLCVINGGTLMESQTGRPGEQFLLLPGTVWQLGNHPESDPARKAPGIALMVIEDTP